jgi:hypothetical protein
MDVPVGQPFEKQLCPFAPFQLVRVSHSHDHTFVQPLQEPSPPNLRSWLNVFPLRPEANVDTIRQHRPSWALYPAPIRSTLASAHRCVNQVKLIAMLPGRRRSLANSVHG